MASAGLTWALNNGMTADQYYQNIFDFVLQNQGMSDADLRSVMDQYGISPTDVAQATGTKPEAVQQRYEAIPVTAPEPVYTPPAPPSLLETPPEAPAYVAPVETPAYVAPVETPAYVAPVVAPVITPVSLLETPVTAPVAAPVTAPVGLLESPVVTAPVTTGSNMATSAALNYALNNGMTQAQFDKRIFDAVVAAQKAGTSNTDLRIEMDRLGITPEDVARATGVTTQSVAEKYAAAVPTTQAELIAKAAADAELAARTARDTTASAATIAAARQAATTSQGLLSTADQTAATAAAATLAAQQKAAADAQAVINAKAAADAKAAAALKTKTTTTPTGLNAQLEKAYKDGDIALLNSLLAQNQVTSAQAKNMFNLTDADLSWIQNNAGGKFYTPPTTPTATPGANMGIGGSFANFQSIPIGAQYNPAVTAGGASPYSQIMGQMKPFTNPYQNVVTNTPMGGYDPGLYDKIEAANVAKTIATQEADRLAATQTGMEQSSTGGLAGGGMVHGGLMFGMNPPGPDDGAVNLDLGEYVVKKSAVNKYGRGLLDMINEGKVPAKKMKSLLG